MEQMSLMKSAAHEVLRIDQLVQVQYGTTKKDLVIESHNAAFRVKKGEMIFGYQPFATKDPKIFEKPDEYVADRFLGDGEKLLKHVLWSNGPKTENPTLENKQCPGKDFVVLMCWMFFVELFLRYDTFEVTVETATLGESITISSLTKATY